MKCINVWKDYFPRIKNKISEKTNIKPLTLTLIYLSCICCLNSHGRPAICHTWRCYSTVLHHNINGTRLNLLFGWIVGLHKFFIDVYCNGMQKCRLRLQYTATTKTCIVLSDHNILYYSRTLFFSIKIT